MLGLRSSNATCFNKSGTTKNNLKVKKIMIPQEHNKLMYDKYGEQYHLKRSNKENSLWNEYLDIPAMTKLIEKNVNQCDVLDLGCGSGNFTAKVKSLGANVIGLDQSNKMIEIARREHPEIEFYVGTAEKIPFNDKSFQLIYSCLMIH